MLSPSVSHPWLNRRTRFNVPRRMRRGIFVGALGVRGAAAPRRQSLLRSQARCALLPAATPRLGVWSPAVSLPKRAYALSQPDRHTERQRRSPATLGRAGARVLTPTPPRALTRPFPWPATRASEPYERSPARARSACRTADPSQPHTSAGGGSPLTLRSE